MTDQGATKAVTTSALIVGGIYAYRRFSGAPTTGAGVAGMIGRGGVLPLRQFVTAWGFTFLVIAMFAEASPGFGGAFALLVATADGLANAPALSASVLQGIGTPAGASTSGSALGPLVTPAQINRLLAARKAAHATANKVTATDTPHGVTDPLTPLLAPGAVISPFPTR